jgi:S1-C subfamily serine protease
LDGVHADALDLILVVLVVLSAISGYRQGFVVGIMSFIGLLGGAAVGAQLAPPIAKHFAGAVAPFAGVAIVFAVASLGRLGAGALGAIVRRRLRWQPARNLDSAGGAVVSGIAVLLIGWFIGSSLIQAPFPAVARQVNGSRVLTAVDHQMPSDVRTWFADFRTVVAGGGFPQVFGALGAERIIPVAVPDPAEVQRPAIVHAAASMVKVIGDARSCSRRIEGSGFVYAAGRVMTNAHVVAGVRNPQVQLGGVGPLLSATVVLYDPRIDVAVLVVPRLHVPSLPFSGPLGTSDDAVVAGFPEDGPYTTTPARVRGAELARGPDIYQDADVTRSIYAVRADVQPGNSGGPLLDRNGAVAGVVFGKAVNDASTGYALTAAQVSAAATAGRTATAPVSTRGCD